MVIESRNDRKGGGRGIGDEERREREYRERDK